MKKKFLLHTCCAPCLVGANQSIKDDFDIFWFNPTIFPKNEYDKRLKYLKYYAQLINKKFIAGDQYEDDNLSMEKLFSGLENEPEGGKRCLKCFKYRLLVTAKYALDNNYQYFSTTLTVSPHKDAAKINDLGRQISKQIGIKYQPLKNIDYKKSIIECRELNIYRQKYCGCTFSSK